MKIGRQFYVSETNETGTTTNELSHPSCLHITIKTSVICNSLISPAHLEATNGDLDV